MLTMRCPSTGRSQTVEGTAESLSPKCGHFQNPLYCIQNHAENALPKVLTGFRTNRRRGGIAFPQTTMLCPKYWRDSESINGMGEPIFPQSTGGSWTHRKSVFLKYWRRTTNDPDEPRIRARGGAGWPFPGCGVAGGAARKEIRCLSRGVNLEDRTQRLAPFGNHAG